MWLLHYNVMILELLKLGDKMHKEKFLIKLEW